MILFIDIVENIDNVNNSALTITLALPLTLTLINDVMVNKIDVVTESAVERDPVDNVDDVRAIRITMIESDTADNVGTVNSIDSVDDISIVDSDLVAAQVRFGLF